MPNFEEWYIPTFEQNVNYALQQKNSLLVPTVKTVPCTGEKTSTRYMNDFELEERTEKFGNTRMSQADFELRWITTKIFDKAFPIIEEDVEKALTDPTSDFTANAVFAANRCKDARIIAALGGSVQTGRVDNITTTAYDSNQVIDVTTGSTNASNVGMNEKKIRAAKRMFDEAEIDPADRRIILISPYQSDEMLDILHFTSADYTDDRVIREGVFKRALGFDFIVTNLLPLSSGIRMSFAYTTNSMAFTQRGGFSAKSAELPEHNFERVIQFKLQPGAARRYDKGVIKIPCAEA